MESMRKKTDKQISIVNLYAKKENKIKERSVVTINTMGHLLNYDPLFINRVKKKANQKSPGSKFLIISRENPQRT